MEDKATSRKDVTNNDKQRRHAIDELLKVTASGAELRDVISYLIRNREQLHDEEIERLERESEELIKKLNDTKRLKLLEEIKCFKDVLALHKRLFQNNEREH